MVKSRQYFWIFFIAITNLVNAEDFHFGQFPGDFSWGLTNSIYKTGGNGNYSCKLFDSFRKIT